MMMIRTLNAYNNGKVNHYNDSFRVQIRFHEYSSQSEVGYDTSRMGHKENCTRLSYSQSNGQAEICVQTLSGVFKRAVFHISPHSSPGIRQLLITGKVQSGQ